MYSVDDHLHVLVVVLDSTGNEFAGTILLEIVLISLDRGIGFNINVLVSLDPTPTTPTTPTPTTGTPTPPTPPTTPTTTTAAYSYYSYM